MISFLQNTQYNQSPKLVCNQNYEGEFFYDGPVNKECEGFFMLQNLTIYRYHNYMEITLMCHTMLACSSNGFVDFL